MGFPVRQVRGFCSGVTNSHKGFVFSKRLAYSIEQKWSLRLPACSTNTQMLSLRERRFVHPYKTVGWVWLEWSVEVHPGNYRFWQWGYRGTNNHYCLSILPEKFRSASRRLRQLYLLSTSGSRCLFDRFGDGRNLPDKILHLFLV